MITAICLAQQKNVTISGLVTDKLSQEPLGYVNVVLFAEKDSAFVSGTVSAEDGRFSIPNVSPGVKKLIQKGKGEMFLNATDLFNTLIIKKKIQGTNFSYTSDYYFETQVIRAGYSFKF